MTSYAAVAAGDETLHRHNPAMILPFEVRRRHAGEKSDAPPHVPTTIQIDEAPLLSTRTLPTEVLGRLESYLAPSDCAHLSATCFALKRRWTATRWRLTFRLHYGGVDANIAAATAAATTGGAGSLTAASASSPSNPERAASFVGCCCDFECEHTNHSSGSRGSKGKRGGASSSSSSSRQQNTRQQQRRPQRDGDRANSDSSSSDEASSDNGSSHRHVRQNSGGSSNSGDSALLATTTTTEATQFNVSALLPSVRNAYASLWDTIELSLLGYYGAHYNLYRRRMMAAAATHNNNINDAAVGNDDGVAPPDAAAGDGQGQGQEGGGAGGGGGAWMPAPPPETSSAPLSDLMEYLFFIIGLKPLAFAARRRRWARRRNGGNGGVGGTTIGGKVGVGEGGGSSRQRKFDPLLAVRSSTTSMSAWKLACILKERGVDCIRCGICDQIDLGGSNVPHSTWMRPCNCPELVHRRCLERKLGMVTRFTLDHRNRMWISYDDSQADSNAGGVIGNASVNERNELTNPLARCDTCGTRYCRSVRLPHTKAEVVLASISDPLSRLRAFSTFVHFLLCCVVIGATEGMCRAEPCRFHYAVMDHPLVLRWPSRGGLALAWWQLQQCCMLHIFFSPRFAAVVDRLWMGPIRYFYCRLYLYFLVTSAILAVSYLPFVTRAVEQHLLAVVLTPQALRTLTPLFDLFGLLNLAQYAVVSTMVVCIFWRTNIRIFTIADRREEASWEWEARRNTHPIYHGQWQ